MKSNILYSNYISGNMKLTKWTASSLRRAGLCADHFSLSSFTGEDKKKLKRNAIPVRFNDGAQNDSEPSTSGVNNNMDNLAESDGMAKVYSETIADVYQSI